LCVVDDKPEENMLDKRYNYDNKAIIPLSKSQGLARDNLINTLYSGKYTMETVACECGNATYDVLAEKDRYGLPVKTVICDKCGLIYQNPRLSEESSNHFYSVVYRDLYSDSNSIEDLFIDQLLRGRRIARWIHDKIGHYPENVVEIGCGAGGILQAFRDKGCNTIGVDFNKKYLDYGISKGLDLRTGDARQLLKSTSDLVLLSHVLEHFLNIEKELQTISCLLKASGNLYIELPGIFNLRQYSFDFLRSLQNAHNYYFSLETLQQVMGLFGWQFESGNEKIYSLFTFKNQKTPIRKSHYAKTLRKLRNTEKIRKIFSPAIVSGLNSYLSYLTNR